MFEYKDPSYGFTVQLNFAGYNPCHKIIDGALVIELDDDGYIRNILVHRDRDMNPIPLFGGRFYGGFKPEFRPNYSPYNIALKTAKTKYEVSQKILEEIADVQRRLDELKRKASDEGIEV